MVNTYCLIYQPCALPGSTQNTFKTHEQTKKSSPATPFLTNKLKQKETKTKIVASKQQKNYLQTSLGNNTNANK